MNSDELKHAIPIRAVFERYGVKPDAHNFACCPFHSEDTPSLKIYPETGTFHCFGCGVSGDIFTLVEHFESCDFKTAFKILGGGYENDPGRMRRAYEIQSAIEAQKRKRDRERKALLELARKIRLAEARRDAADPASMDYLKACRDVEEYEAEYFDEIDGGRG